MQKWVDRCAAVLVGCAAIGLVIYTVALIWAMVGPRILGNLRGG